MNIDEIKLLINAGFTKDEIISIVGTPVNFSGSAPDPAPAAPAPAEPAAPAPAEPAAPAAPAPAEPAAPAAPAEGEPSELANTVNSLTATVKELSKTVKAIQQRNVLEASGKRPETKTSGDVIKDFFSK